MAESTNSFSGEFFILGEEWGLYEELVPRENFSDEEIRSKHSRRYHSADGRSIYACPLSIAERKISLAELEKYFQPILRLTRRVQTCEFNNPPDYYRSNAFALIPPDDTAKVKSGLYGEQADEMVTHLFGSGICPLSEFAKSLAVSLSQFCTAHRLILLKHSEYLLDVSNPTELLRPEQE